MLNVDVAWGSGVEPRLPDGEVEAAARWVLEREGAAAAELSVALLADAEIASLNQRYLSHAGPTDVISFPLPDPAGTVVGDVYVGVEQAARQAAELGVPLREEILRLVVHGTLHVLGHDHPAEAEARDAAPMYRRQEELLGDFLRSRPAP
jgi:probable rRNA maturation factor